MTDSGDTHQLVEYREHLVRTGILGPFRGWYRAGTAASLYPTRGDYEARYEALGRSFAG